MKRDYNTDIEGRLFSDDIVETIWQKAHKIPGKELGVWRADDCGNAILRSEYGNTKSEHGWEIDHIQPVAKDGGDELSNLRALQWQENRNKGDNYPWTC